MPALRPRFLYTGIRVRDLPRSIRFYRALGFRVLHRGRMEHGGSWVHLTTPGYVHRIELNFYPRSNPYFEPFRAGTELDHFGFYAPDVDAWVRSLRRRHIPIVLEFTEGRF